MASARSLIMSVFGAVLSAASLVCAQAVKPAEAKAIVQRTPTIQELELQPQGLLAFALPAPALPASISTPDLSRYREFQFGMSLLAVAKQGEMNPSDARMIRQRPAVIQELTWRPQRFLVHSAQSDPVQEVTFSFYNDQLFRMVINYDQFRTEGLSDEDMIEAISAKYGSPTRPDAKVILFSSSEVYNDSENVIARWEDAQYSFNLFRSSYQPVFGVLVFSKRLDPPAQAAIAEAIRLDEQEAPAREIALQKKQDQQNRAEQDKARLANKAAFRP
ncbi:MAG TPA: hypothetical protein VG204_14495 [Terriglobia bacterium]|nr:hypothetical protein [Terriglobia bacterium]